MKKDPLMTIITPVKGERYNIAWIIDKIEKTVTAKHEILIIYDSVKDNTLPIARKLKKKNKNLRLIKNENGYGVLNAIKTGINKARGDVVVVIAADRTDDPTTINKMYKKILEGYDIVCPTRYSRGGKVIGKTTIKSILSRLSGIATPFFLGIPTSDLTYSFKMFRKNILDRIKIESKGGFEFAEELLIKSHFAGFKIIEIPTLWIDRKYGKSKFKLIRWLPRYIYWYLWGISNRVKALIMNNMTCLIKKHYFLLIIILFSFYAALSIYRSSFVVHDIRYFLLSDDLMIQMKYGYNLIHGHGLVWNAGGERVEGFSDPLWVIYLGILQFIPLPLSKISILVQISGAIFTVGSLYFVKKIAAFVSNSNFFVIFLSIIFTAFYFPLINWSIILGTETSILTLLLTSTTYLALKSAVSRKFSFLLCFFLGAGTLIRMDFVIPAIIILSYLIILDLRNRRKYLVFGVLTVLSFIAAQEILRFWYYRELLPNTYYFRMTGYPIFMRMTRGLFVSVKAFMPNLISLNWLLILAPFVYVYLTRNRKILLLLSIFTGQILYNIYVGGGSWEHYGGANHYFAFVMPLFFISLMMTIGSLRKSFNHFSIDFQKPLKIIGILSICLFFIVLNRGDNNTWSLGELFMVGQNITTLEKRMGVEFSYRLNAITKPNAKIAIAAAGIVPYFTQRYYIDLLGKNDKLIAREPAHFGNKYYSLMQKYTSFYPGHMKWDYPYVLKKYKPDIFASLYQRGDEHNEKYLKKDYKVMISPEGYEFYVLKGSPNVILTDLKPHIISLRTSSL